jgi:regulator of nucleoside diphosphate kinase
MSKRNIYITEQDMNRLRELLRITRDQFGKERPYLDGLRAELDRARVVAAEKIDADRVTMNSMVRVRDTDGSRITTLTVVFPEDADADCDRISVIAPLG